MENISSTRWRVLSVRAGGPQRQAQPRLEALEDRSLPSVVPLMVPPDMVADAEQIRIAEDAVAEEPTGDMTQEITIECFPVDGQYIDESAESGEYIEPELFDYVVDESSMELMYCSFIEPEYVQRSLESDGTTDDPGAEILTFEKTDEPVEFVDVGPGVVDDPNVYMICTMAGENMEDDILTEAPEDASIGDEIFYTMVLPASSPVETPPEVTSEDPVDTDSSTVLADALQRLDRAGSVTETSQTQHFAADHADQQNEASDPSDSGAADAEEAKPEASHAEQDGDSKHPVDELFETFDQPL